MQSKDNNVDLRLLSLLHVLRDKAEFVREVHRLMASTSIDDESWDQICRMGTELTPGNILFTPRRAAAADVLRTGEGMPPGCAGLLQSDRRIQNRRWLCRRIRVARRQLDRRKAALPWLGKERRTWQRRQYGRRGTDLVMQ